MMGHEPRVLAESPITNKLYQTGRISGLSKNIGTLKNIGTVLVITPTRVKMQF